MSRRIFTVTQLALVATITAFGAQAAAHAESYEAWYEAKTDIPKSTVIPRKVHTYYDGKKFYTKTTTALGDTIGYFVEVSPDPSTVEFVKLYGGKPLGKRMIKGKNCDGYQFEDPMEKRLTENWFDDSGKLYYQVVIKSDEKDGKYEQTRTDFKINPQSCSLTTDPDITSTESDQIGPAPATIPVNADDSPFTQTGTEKTKLKKPE